MQVIILLKSYVKRIFASIELDLVSSLLLEEFKSFALKHPEYARIFTTYLELQAGHVFSLPEERPIAPATASNKVSPESREESPSDKKDD